ncbi:hybrid signal transduction histidine kinase M-like [Leptopilina heterotoma]|uniref:hybrid signal transduction histidine kinase M-like n=1 Tax=Leptopilina heterotoma TaxID=63436 RepID=UPI001CA86B7A|nr:hybrid signal transduction histidine kinase M-like [Leptopilina heterotoma]
MENKKNHKESSNYESVDCLAQNTVGDLIILSDKDQETEKPCNLNTNSEIVSRYPELFEIFTESSKSNLNSKSEISSENNIPQELIEKSKKEFTGSLSKFPENHFDEEVRTIKEILLKQKVKEKSPQIKIENIVPEKLSSLQFSNNDDCKKVVNLRKSDRPILLFNTQTNSSLSTIANKNTTKELKIPIKRKNSNDSVLENNSNSKLKKMTDSNDNIRVNLRHNNTISMNLEKNTQGDVNKMKVNEKNDKVKITEEKYEENRKKIFLNVIDTLIGVKAILFENRKLVESIQGYFQNCSIFHTIISDDAVTLLNEGITRCTMRIQCNEKSKDLFVGANELLMESVKNLMKVVKEEREYLKQQGFFVEK